MSKKIFNLSTLAILIIGAMVASYIYKNLSERPSYSEIKVQKGNIGEVLNINGKVRPQDSADLGFEDGGKIVSLTHEVGDFVQAGTVLASSNASDLEAQYRQAQDLARSTGANLDYYEQLLKKEKKELDLLESTNASHEAKDVQRKQIRASEEQVNVQKAAVDAALEGVQNAKAQIAKTRITAPFDGVISHQDVKVGEIAQSGVPIITLISRDAFKIEAYVSEIDVKNLKVGYSAQITLDDNPGQVYNAKITAVDPAENPADNVSSYKVTLNFSDPVSNLRSGVGANAAVAIQEKSDVLVIPRNAVFESGGKKFVYVFENDSRVQKEIQTGIFGSNNQVEVTSGLNVGDTIFILNKKNQG